ARDELGVEVRGDLVQAVAFGAAAAERLADRHRAVDELRLRSEQGAGRELSGQVPQRDERLEAHDPAAGDEHAERIGHSAMLPQSARRAAPFRRTWRAAAAERVPRAESAPEPSGPAPPRKRRARRRQTLAARPAGGADS